MNQSFKQITIFEHDCTKRTAQLYFPPLTVIPFFLHYIVMKMLHVKQKERESIKCSSLVQWWDSMLWMQISN
jgi:hypothetical protein